MKAKDKFMERRRLHAGRLLLKGMSQAEVARQVGVSCPTVHAWKKRLDKDGLAALKNQPRGRPSGIPGGLNSTQLKQLDRLLKKGALSQGFSTERWTLPRIARLIFKEFGLEYGDGQVSNILRLMGWRYRRPGKHAFPEWARGR